MLVISFSVSTKSRPSFATRLGLVVTPSRTPRLAASRISFTLAVSRKIFIVRRLSPSAVTSLRHLAPTRVIHETPWRGRGGWIMNHPGSALIALVRAFFRVVLFAGVVPFRFFFRRDRLFLLVGHGGQRLRRL